MPELSNMLRQRLGATQNGGGTHPDADQLTALAEQQLSGTEREQVLVHLSVCPECREILALSLPQAPELVAEPSLPTQASRWRKIFNPAFGVAGLVTAMAVIAVVVLQVPKRPADQNNQARQEAQATAPSQPAVTETAPAAVPPATAASAPADVKSAISDRRANTGANEARVELRSPAAPSPAAPPPARPKSEADSGATRINQPVLAAGAARQDYVNTGIFDVNAVDSFADNNAVSRNGLPPAPQPQSLAAAARFTVPGQPTVFRDIPANQSAGSRNLAVMTPQPPPEHFGCALCTKIGTTAKKAVHSLSPGSTPALSSGALAFSAMATRSVDLQSQHPVEAKASAETSAPEALPALDSFRSRAGVGGAATASEYEPPAWKVAGGKLIKMIGAQGTEAFPGASFQFTFVSARGSEVWAGGTNASVIHSRDEGGTWQAAKLGDAATGSIVSILFSGNNIQIKTSDDQLWSSADGGKTWAMQ